MQTSTTSKINNTLSHQTESDTTFHYSSEFLEWLRTEEISLAISTYQTNKLFLIGRDTTKHLFVSEKTFDRAMGLHVDSENSFYLSSRFLLWRFENALAEGQIHKEADKVFIPRQAFTIGSLDSHDISKAANGDIVFVNTRYNCIAKVSEKYSFKSIWTPPFISKMIPEDRCHLNGMAMREGKPRYVTMVSQTDRLDAWREHRHNGGIVMDIETNEVLAEGLSMPHSPRYYQDKLWVLNAGRGEFGYVENNKFVPITWLDGFLRGLAFYKNYAIIGLSKPRHERTFAGLPLEELLNKRKAEPRCGIFIVDITTGEIVHSLEAEGEIVELYDVEVLPNTKRPFVVDLHSIDITRFIAIEDNDGGVDFKALSGLKENESKFKSPYSNSNEQLEKKVKDNSSNSMPIFTTNSQNPSFINPNLSATSQEAIHYQVATTSVEQIIQQFDQFTFPRVSLQVQIKKIDSPLMTIIAKNHQQYLGAIIVENLNNGTAKILSWYVLPPFRGLGIGKNLLEQTNKILRKNKFQSMHLSFRSDWKNAEATENILKKQKWEAPQTGVYICKIPYDSYHEIIQTAWGKRATLPEDIELFNWKDLTQKERERIINKKVTENWFEDSVYPFQSEDKIDYATSTGFKYKGEVIGWMITHRSKSDTVEFSAAFVDQNYKGGGLRKNSLFLPLLLKSIELGSKDGAKYGTWQISHQNKTMLKFTEKFLKPYLTTFTELKFAYKVL